MQEPPPSVAPAKPGDVLAGKYRVERVLGAGGMGVVVAATHMQLGELVALKFLLPRSLDKPDTVTRFLREARAAVRIKNEHVARVSDVGTLENGSPYIVMEHLEGRDLGEVLEDDGPLRAELAVSYVLQACEAIAEAHALGIVHRDLKPSNLFVARRIDGAPVIKVLDFGIAKATSLDDSDAITATNTTMGSPRYMSPEQVRSARQVDPRSDIWSLGVILHELVAGAPPFTGESAASLLAALVMDQPKRLRDARPDAPEELERVVLRCLEKEPDRRYANVAELARALAPLAPDARTSVELLCRISGARADDPVPEPEAPAGAPGRIRLRPRAVAAADQNAVATVRDATNPPETMSTAPPAKRPQGSLVPLLAAVAVIGGGLVVLASTRGDRPPPPNAESTDGRSSAAKPANDPPPASTAAPTTPPEPVVAPVTVMPSASEAAPGPARTPPGAARPVRPVTPPPAAAPAPTADRRGSDRH